MENDRNESSRAGTSGKEAFVLEGFAGIYPEDCCTLEVLEAVIYLLSTELHPVPKMQTAVRSRIKTPTCHNKIMHFQSINLNE